VHSRSLLRVRGDNVLCDRVLDVPLDERVQIRREDTSKMVRDIRAQKQLLDLVWKALYTPNKSQSQNYSNKKSEDAHSG
jgi:hypothetical protein